jgi:hypothetical protein
VALVPGSSGTEKLRRKLGSDQMVELDPALSLVKRHFVIGDLPNLACDLTVTHRVFHVATSPN